MAKYTFKIKKEIVSAYLNGNKSYNQIVAFYKIPSSSSIKRWVHSYQKFGDEGLLRTRKNKNYSFKFKLHVVELYLSSEVMCYNLLVTRYRK